MWLSKPYNKKEFEDFLSDFLPDDLELSEKELDKRELDKYREIKSGIVLGECASLGLKILQLEHEKERDPRVALANEAFKIMAENWSKKALVIFKSKNSDNWRLSFMTISFDINEKNKIAINLSNPKRKSFFLGPDAKIVTPERFLIKKGRVKDIEDLESCFDVEVVTKEFFDNYRKLFDRLNNHLKEDKAFNVFAGNNKIKIDDFAKRLLGQIVFIYFLQKKGWLGAKKEQHIHEGDSNFLRNLYNRCENEKENFFNNTLEYLFYDAFNKESEKAGSFYREYFDCQIPFLNGGLFEPLNKYNWKSEFLHIPNKLFSSEDKTGILDVFDLYNFTIDENNPIDQEVSVDPEMLGKVFEKLLDTNKETGSFYTPREIVSYMVKQSLIEYLKTKTNVNENIIEELINKHYRVDNRYDKKELVEIESALKEIKIIDPAVGSGAFPVGILQEMTEIRFFCQKNISINPKSLYSIKKEILENNIYGVDIDHGAIDIARLRFWLSLVVDADLFDVEPLPNLDFKLVAANSLLKIDHEEGLYDEKDLLEKMKQLREKYFRARTKNSKEKIQNNFSKIIRDSRGNMFATERQKQIATYNPFSSSSVSQFFDSEFMFGIKEFDLVIGNPPYVNIRNINKEEKDIYKNKYYTASGQYDLYVLFIERSLELSKKKSGLISFITPNKFLISGYGLNLRKLIAEKTCLLDFVDHSKANVFKSVSVYPVVFLIKNIISERKEKQEDYDLLKVFGFNKDDSIIKKLEAIQLTLGDCCIIKEAVHTGNVRNKIILQEKINDNCFKILRGKDCGRYSVNWKGFYLNYSYNLNKESGEYANIVDKSFFMKPKLFLREIALRPTAVYDDRGFFSLNKAYVLKEKNDKINLKFINGLLNSKLISYFFEKKFGDIRVGGGYLQFKKQFTSKIPVLLKELYLNRIIILVDKILEITLKENYNSKNLPVEQIELEKEIDKIVYELYGLTKEEIKIINKI